MILRGKKGVSPVVATVLLVALGVILAIIVFMWARSFIGESLLKDGENIDSKCEEVNFNAEYLGGNINIVNNGNVPVYAIEIRESGFGSVSSVEVFESTISNGEDISVPTTALMADTTYIVVPILLGESGGEQKMYTCDKKYGVEITG